MPKASAGPSTEQLLELLKRAADELKTSRDESARLSKELSSERKKREEAEAAVQSERTIGGQHPKMRAQLEEVQALYQDAKKALEQTRAELQEIRENLVNEVAAQREMKSALERESGAHSETRQALEAEQNAHLQTRAELDQERKNAEDVLEQRMGEVQQQLEQAQSQLQAEKARLAEHTETLATALAERDTLLARIDAIEAARKTDRDIEDAKLKEIEDRTAAQAAKDAQAIAEVSAALQAEKDKHQAMAQKFLEEKKKARELESALQEAKTRVGELESATVAAAEQHAKELTDREALWKNAEAQWLAIRAELEARMLPLQQQVESTMQERMYVERKYEEQSRELQMTLEQRDEVRRLLDNVQAERQRLERALQQR